jgi:hypothetical protein
MSVQTERAIKSLFRGNGEQVVNVKFFLGSKRGVTSEELAEQLNRADAQIRSGTAVRSTHLDGDLTENRF